jgi:uncharacterized RDD family membrane protein YckC
MSEYASFTDQLNIETPEQVDLRFPIAGVGSRFLAVLVDTLIRYGSVVLLVILVALFADAAPVRKVTVAATGSPAAQKWAFAAIVLFFFLLSWGYFSFFEAFWKGQTPGKKIFKIRVIKDSGRQITLFEALARNLLRVVVDAQLLYLVGVVSMLRNRQQKRLGDYVAGTIVVHERSEDQPLLAHHSRTFKAALFPQPAVEEWRRPDAVSLAADAIARLDPQDLNMIETFLARALDLSMDRREDIGRKMAVRLAAKMRVAMPEGIWPETFLQEIAYQMRAQTRH